jgi:hypothetical protein
MLDETIKSDQQQSRSSFDFTSDRKKFLKTITIN